MLAVLAVGLGTSWVYWYGLVWDTRLFLGAAACGLLLLVAERFPIAVGERWSIDASDIVLIVAVALIGPFWVALSLFPSTLLVAGRNVDRLVYENARSVVEVFFAGMVFSFVSPPLISGGLGVATPAATYATLLAGATLLAVNHAANGGLLLVKYGQSFRTTWKELVEPYLITDALNVLTSGLCVLTLLFYGPVAAVVVVAGATVSQALVYKIHQNVRENRELKARISSLERSLALSNLTFGVMMIEDLGKTDGYTHLHAAATSVYAADIAEEMGLDARTKEKLRTAGLLHNIGMFGAPGELLTATGKLNSVAKARINRHPELGESALASVPEFSDIAKWVRWHHERPDGRGYPDRLRAAWIPLESRILAVAQAYAAMVLDQPRRAAPGPAAAREQLNLGAGKQFDEVVVRAFLRILDTESEGYRSADDHRFGFGPRGANLYRREDPGEASDAAP